MHIAMQFLTTKVPTSLKRKSGLIFSGHLLCKPHIAVRAQNRIDSLFLTPKVGVIVVACAVQAVVVVAAGIKLAGVPQIKLVQRFPSIF